MKPLQNSCLPPVTVVMPVRNEESFIRESLGAVLNQDYPLDFLEVIVADGRSDDGNL
jgi:glycosyltransferase involved in cell wall biosynthesis